jgi:hypothetical protein
VDISYKTGQNFLAQGKKWVRFWISFAVFEISVRICDQQQRHIPTHLESFLQNKPDLYAKDDTYCLRVFSIQRRSRANIYHGKQML